MHDNKSKSVQYNNTPAKITFKTKIQSIFIPSWVSPLSFMYSSVRKMDIPDSYTMSGGIIMKPLMKLFYSCTQEKDIMSPLESHFHQIMMESCSLETAIGHILPYILLNISSPTSE